jgi:hypothetical protein
MDKCLFETIGQFHLALAKPADVAGDFAPAGRMTNMNRVLQVKLLDEFREIIVVGVQFIALPKLARGAMTPHGFK